MHSPSHDGQYAAVALQYAAKIDATQAPTSLAGPFYGPEWPGPANAAPTQQLQQWAVAARTAEGEAAAEAAAAAAAAAA
eukprot:CAMPEP_0183362786 /NCGR_PEP_ID=MMETSP0164_2-20130417/71406_1 /TAXON_ID=221442 /ORGANISM="Coccolithus pelagicus ssp braarudi, Strain PLY182g" /LENGTH=78 /DNA_ID=CAMNT_0025537727 /DNA_START=1 /DNA_END=234 /DNA_ORIENTATION=+